MFFVKLIFVFDWFEYVILLFNSQIGYKKYGNFFYCKQQIFVGEQVVKNFIMQFERDWVVRFGYGIFGSSYEEYF